MLEADYNQLDCIQKIEVFILTYWRIPLNTAEPLRTQNIINRNLSFHKISEYGDVPGVLRFGKRIDGAFYPAYKRDMPGVLRFGKREQEKKNVPG